MKTCRCAFGAAVVLVCIMAGFLSNAAGQPPWLDSVEARYASAARDYDSVTLIRAAEAIVRRPAADRGSPRALLALGLIYWRLELIGYCVDDRTRVIRYGEKAIAALSRAEKAGADRYLTASHKALASQLIAAQGAAKGMIYGPRSAREAKKARGAAPQGYFTLLVEAANAAQAPAIAGGDPERAAGMLEKLRRQFPDSIDVAIHLARTYVQTGRSDDARKLMAPVIAAHPENLFARMAAREAELPHTEK